eukprot:15347178-Ditylum_brightwellii.AAC.1
MTANVVRDAWTHAKGGGGMSHVIPGGKIFERLVLTFLLSLDQCTRRPFKPSLNEMLIMLRE